jgi:hypothetical protein
VAAQEDAHVEVAEAQHVRSLDDQHRQRPEVGGAAHEAVAG